MKTSNPAFSEKAFTREVAAEGAAAMSLGGIAAKTGILLGIMLWSGSWTWNWVMQNHGQIASGGGYLIGAMLLALVAAMVGIFSPRTAVYAAPVYATLEGVVLGAVSAVYHTQYKGLPFQAVGLTALTLFAMLVLYGTGVIKPTQKFMLGVAAATGAIFLYYIFALVLSFFDMQAPGIWSNGWMGIGFSLVVVGVAALNLIIDFAVIEDGVRNRAPKYLEWRATLGLLITLVLVKWNRMVEKMKYRQVEKAVATY